MVIVFLTWLHQGDIKLRTRESEKHYNQVINEVIQWPPLNWITFIKSDNINRMIQLTEDTCLPENYGKSKKT
jgi:hypothetical protein